MIRFTHRDARSVGARRFPSNGLPFIEGKRDIRRKQATGSTVNSNTASIANAGLRKSTQTPAVEKKLDHNGVL
jgi:hypothetical protein